MFSQFIAHAGSGSVQLPAGRERSYSLENPQTPLDDPSVWSDGLLSSSGRKVNPTTMLYLPAALQAVERISGDVARCPLEIYAENNGTYKPLYDDPLYRLTAIEPNREMDFFTFWQQVMVFRLVWRNAYIFIAPTPSGEPGELFPLLPDRTEPKREGGVLYYETETDGVKVPLPANRVIHLRGIAFDNLKAVELTRLMRTAFGLALAQFDFTSKVYRSGGRRGGVLELPLGMPKTAQEKAEEGFRKKYEENGAWFTTVILRDNVKFHEAQMTLRDSQVIEGREESARDVARAFNIRPGHLGVETSGVYGNKSDDTRDYLDMTLRPHMTAIAAKCRVKLLPRERQARNCFGHNTDELLQMSVKEEFEAYGAGVEATVITSNEARGKLGFPSHPDGDKLRSPHTQGPGDRGGVPPRKKPPAKPAAGDENDDDDYNALNAAHVRLLHESLDAVFGVLGEKASRAAASGAKFCAWLDGKLAGERETVTRAVAPIAGCIAAHRGQDAAALTDQIVRDVFDPLAGSLARLAETNSEAGLRAAVLDQFQTWRMQPCLATIPKAA